MEHAIYITERGNPLIPTKPSSNGKALVCLENYGKWYDVFLLNSDGSVESVPTSLVTQISSILFRPTHVDHCYHPELLVAIATYLKAEWCEISYQLAFGRWLSEVEIDYPDSNVYHEHVIKLMTLYANGELNLPAIEDIREENLMKRIDKIHVNSNYGGKPMKNKLSPSGTSFDMSVSGGFGEVSEGGIPIGKPILIHGASSKGRSHPHKDNDSE